MEPNYTRAADSYLMCPWLCIEQATAADTGVAECTHITNVLHGESITDQASPRTPTHRTFQPQEAVQPQRNQTILQADTPAQKANYPYNRAHPTPLEAEAGYS